MKMPYEECPRFNSCSINICPLDPFIHQKEKLFDEQDCPMEKGVRLKLGKDLQSLGLTPRELQGKRRWEALPEANKEATRQRMRVVCQTQIKTA